MCLNGYMLLVRREASARPAGMAGAFGPELATARQVPGTSGYA